MAIGIGSLTSSSGGGSTEYIYENLRKQYNSFQFPTAIILVNGKQIGKAQRDLVLSDIEVENCSGYEASMASFCIYNTYIKDTSTFAYDEVKDYIMLGSLVQILLGYDKSIKNVFTGFISKINFFFQEDDIPGIMVTAMDAKGIMMANSYAKQLTATSYSAAVSEIFEGAVYTTLVEKGIIAKLDISDTPDAQQGAGAGTASGGNKEDSDQSIEMVSESDYEFIVKCAKKFNYEFFVYNGVVKFRKAKEKTDILIEIGPGEGLREIDIEYDITGLVESVEVRSVDPGKAQLIKKSVPIKNKLSQKNMAKQLLSKASKVYIDPTVSSEAEAGYRAEYLKEDISYRYGTLKATMVGLPELEPGRFIRVHNLGEKLTNRFYLTSVRHILSKDGYVTKIEGKSDKQES